MKFDALVFAAVFISSCLPLASNAQSLRCKGDLASIGDAKASILRKCGEPVLRDSFCAPAKQESLSSGVVAGTATANVQSCENVDEWTYNPGVGQFLTILQFKGGSLASIRYGDRVK